MGLDADWVFGGPDVFNFFQRARQFPPLGGQIPPVPPVPPMPIVIRHGVGGSTSGETEYTPKSKRLELASQYDLLLEHGDITTSEWVAIHLLHGVNP